jgi:hypothetical protein
MSHVAGTECPRAPVPEYKDPGIYLQKDRILSLKQVSMLFIHYDFEMLTSELPIVQIEGVRAMSIYSFVGISCLDATCGSLVATHEAKKTIQYRSNTPCRIPRARMEVRHR